MNNKFKGLLLEKQNRKSIDISLFSQRVEIRWDDEVKNYDLSQLDLELGGNNQSLVFFKLKDNPDQCFYIHKKKELIQFLKNQNHSQYEKIILDKKKHTQNNLQIYTLVFVSFVGFIYLLAWLKTPMVNGLVDMIPMKYEKMIGDKLIGLYLPPTKMFSKEEVNKELKKLLEPIKKAYKNKMDVQFYISNESELNAFALPGGHVVFNLGMLKSVTQAEEILGVAAHELAHVSERHVIKNILQTSGVFLVIQTLFGDVSGLLAVLSDGGAHLLTMNFSRDNELEADNVGFDHLLKSGIDPRGMSEFFKKLKEKRSELENKAEENLPFLSTHPQTQERIDNIYKKYEALSKEQRSRIKPVPFDIDKFKESL